MQHAERRLRKVQEGVLDIILAVGTPILDDGYTEKEVSEAHAIAAEIGSGLVQIWDGLTLEIAP